MPSEHTTPRDVLGNGNRRMMTSQMTNVIYIVLMVAVIVAVDVLFFKDYFRERLIVNVGLVLVFGAFYLRFLKRP